LSDSTPGAENDAPTPALQRGLRQRHVTLIALGGMIGGGFFVGSGAVISAAGPASLLSYAVAGVIIILVMRALGEMAVARPHYGSFAAYAHRAIGPWAGFTSGWLYWYFWAVVIGYEAIAGAHIVQGWIPGVPAWVIGCFFIAALTVTNLFSVRSFGEFEFWFASIKVAAIFVFFGIVILALLGVDFGAEDGGATVSNLTSHGGFFAVGVVPVMTAVASIFFAMQGGEIATIAAAESDAPRRAIARATQVIVVRQATFFLLSVFLILCAVPWDAIGAGESPFAAALEALGIPAAATIMNAVVLIAVLSALNSGIYITSRMLFGLANHGHAPQWTVQTNRRGVPARAIVVATVFGYLGVLGAIISPDDIFAFLLNSSGAVMLFVYILIAASELRMRRQLERTDPEALQIKMWAFPYLTWLAILSMVAVLVAMALDDSLRTQLLTSFISLGVILAGFGWLKLRGRAPADVSAVAPLPLIGADEAAQ
jgi:GABA permease